MKLLSAQKRVKNKYQRRNKWTESITRQMYNQDQNTQNKENNDSQCKTDIEKQIDNTIK